MSLLRLTLEVLSENIDCNFFALDMRSRGVGMEVAAKILTATVRSYLPGGVMAPLTTIGSELSTCRLRFLLISIALSYVSEASAWRAERRCLY